MKSFLRNRKWLPTATSTLLLLLLWEAVSLIVSSEQILPGPTATAVAVAGLLTEKGFLRVVAGTILRAVAGFAAALAGGILAGIAGGLNSRVNSFLQPWIVVLRSTPVVAFVLLALIWFKSDSVPVLIGFLTMFPIIYLNTAEGIGSVDRKLVEMARFYGVHGARLVREVYLPAIGPFAASGISTAVGMGWRAIVVGEVLSQPRYGIGTAMHSAQTFLQVDVLIAWTLVTILVGAAFEKAVRIAQRRIERWK